MTLCVYDPSLHRATNDLQIDVSVRVFIPKEKLPQVIITETQQSKCGLAALALIFLSGGGHDIYCSDDIG